MAAFILGHLKTAARDARRHIPPQRAYLRLLRIARLGLRDLTIARSLRCGSSTGAGSKSSSCRCRKTCSDGWRSRRISTIERRRDNREADHWAVKADPFEVQPWGASLLRLPCLR